MLSIGAEIVTIRNVGPVREGTRGVVVAVSHAPFLHFWTRRVYLCTFAGHINLAVRPSEIADCDHAHGHWRSLWSS